MSKYGRRNGLQRYRCDECPFHFQSTPRKRKGRNKRLWTDYAFKRKTITTLHEETGMSESQLRRIIHATPAPLPTLTVDRGGTPIVLVIDTTYFDSFGVMVFRSWPGRKNLLWYFVHEETNPVYLAGLSELQRKGYRILAVVCDGKKWLPESISDCGIPVQLCQFHVVKTVTRYLTRHPALPAGQELRFISLQLKHSSESEFRLLLDQWLGRWSDFLKEKTVDPETGRWQYTHRRIRAAYRSIINALPYLFTYQKFPKGVIPNTTNTLDGSFSQLKQKVHVHRGLRKETQMKMVTTLLAAPAKKSTRNEY